MKEVFAGLALALAISAPAAAELDKLPQVGAWRMAQETSRLDGARSVTASTDSLNVLTDSLGQPSRAGLMVACMGGEGLALIVQWPDVVDVVDVPVEWRIGQGAIVRERWAVTRDGVGTIRIGPAVRQMVEQMKAGGSFVIRARGAREAEFALDGAELVEAQLAAACPA